MSSDDTILATSGLTKQFGRLNALRDVSLELRRGGILTIFGRNGAGKTTLLKIVSTLMRTWTGTARLFGRDLRGADGDIRKRIGFVSHESFLYSDLTVRDNLLFYGRMYDLDDPAAAADDAIVQMGLETKTATPVRALSRGMKQRLSLGRAFLHKPELVLLDEPFTGLDERAADTLHSLIDSFAAGGGAVLMATHAIERGWRHPSRIAVLERGVVVFESTADEMTIEDFRERYRAILAGGA